MQELTKNQEFNQKNKNWKYFFYTGAIICALYFLVIKANDFGVPIPFVGNFNTIFIMFTTITGIMFLKYLFSWKKDPLFQEIIKGNRIPPWIDWSYPFFPWIFAYAVMRMFIYEPYVIPSGSMMPTLQIKTLVFVNKFDTFILNPLNNDQIKKTGTIERGDVLVFKYPENEKVSYIKRVIGVPGDTITWNYMKEELTINGVPSSLRKVDDKVSEESIPTKDGKVSKYLIHTRLPNDNISFPSAKHLQYTEFNQHCEYAAEILTCKVPEKRYFMMGDNRNASADSRFWGLLQEDKIIGKAKGQLDIFNFIAGKL